MNIYYKDLDFFKKLQVTIDCSGMAINFSKLNIKKYSNFIHENRLLQVNISNFAWQGAS